MKRLFLTAFFIFFASPTFAGPIEDTRKIMAATVTTNGAAYKEYLAGKRDNTAVFQRVLKTYIGLLPPITPPPAPTPLPTTWVDAPLTNGGYAQIVRAEPCCDIWAATHSMSPAAAGSVWHIADTAGGWAAITNRKIAVLYPQDKVGVQFAAIYVYTDTLKGLAPAIPRASIIGGNLVSTPVVVNVDDSYRAVGIKRCLTGGNDTQFAMSSVEIGLTYIVSRRQAGEPTNSVQMVTAKLEGAVSGITALVPENCLRRL